MEYSLDFSYAGHNLGLLYERQNDPAQAEESYRRAIAVDDLWPPPKANLALLLARQGKNDEAETLLREVARHEPGRRPRSAYSLGLLLAETGRMDEAAALLARAAAGMPSNARAAYNAGLALAQVGRDAEAESDAAAGGRARAVELRPRSSPSPTSCCAGAGSPRSAPLADRMAALDPARPEAAQLRQFLGRR